MYLEKKKYAFVVVHVPWLVHFLAVILRISKVADKGWWLINGKLPLFIKKSKQGGEGVENIGTFLKKPLKFCFFYFTPVLEILDKIKLNPWIFHKIVLELLEIPRPKQRSLEIPHYSFLVTLGNSTSFLINPSWKFHKLFLW